MEDSVKDYNYSRAVRRVVSAGVAPASLDTVARVKAKCPEDMTAVFHEHNTLLPSGGLGKADITINAKQKHEIVEKWASVLKSNPRRSAPAGDGWRNEHQLLALDAAGDALPLILEAIEAQRVPPRVRRHLATSRNLAFLKPDPNDPTVAPTIENGVRPICIPPAIRRTTARPTVKRVSGIVGEKLLKYGQVGCAIRAGVEIPPRIMQCMLELDPQTCIDSEDCYNAFNELSRHEIATCLRRPVNPLAIDVTIGVPGNHGGSAAVTNPHHTTKELAKGKQDKHEAKCKALNYDFLPAAFTSFGGWGEAIMEVLTKEYHARKKQEKKSGGSGWESQRWKQDLLERASIAIAKGNHNMLRNNRTLPAC